MRRGLVAAAALLLLGAAPARAATTFLPYADAVTKRGEITVGLLAGGNVGDVVLGEVVGGRPRPLVPIVEHSSPAGLSPPVNVWTAGGVPWKCGRRTRTVYAEGSDGGYTPLRGEFTVRTPSCANRLELHVRPGRVAIRDTWRLGGVRATLCGPHGCRLLVLPRGRTRAAGRIAVRRGDRISLRTRWQNETVRVGAHPVGGPVVLATGDSLMQNLNVILSDRLGRRARVASAVHLGASLPYGFAGAPSWRAAARRQVARLHPRTTIVFLGTNDGFPIAGAGGAQVACCGAPWVDAYTKLATAVMRVYVQGGAGNVVWVAIPIARQPARKPVTTAINVSLRRAAASVPGVTIVPGDDILTPGGVFRQTMRYHGRRVSVREGDGIHLSLAGSRIIADAIDTILAHL